MVEATQETAFTVFTQQMDLWWPKTHHVGACPMVEAVLEPKPDGRWYSVHEDGSEVNIGKVLMWEPYGRLVLAWQINGDFKFDPGLVTEIELNFIVQGLKKTCVKLEHRDLEKLTGGSKVIDDMNEGWGYIMNLYKDITNDA